MNTLMIMKAYLGLSSFSIFFRRLNKGNYNANGVTIIMACVCLRTYA